MGQLLNTWIHHTLVWWRCGEKSFKTLSLYLQVSYVNVGYSFNMVGFISTNLISNIFASTVWRRPYHAVVWDTELCDVVGVAIG